ncbi:hypothetical protein P3T76_008888 [Phytophthora citrophthora]|uniref:Core-binding (CB) domain-containing protein n=1 Tax=Phytophthora citrophthora TaxID=4793 RepID=A0AAD9LJB5_9STRA|nr:hypothetical protein P3T76_008888 [Phytophthora citrophthora]
MKALGGFLLDKMKGGKVKVSTLSGYRSAVKDLYRQKRMARPSAYEDEMKPFFQGLKRVEAENDQKGRGRRTGKEPLTFSLYCRLAEQTLRLNDNGFCHLFLLSQWNLMCRSKSVETLHISHLECADDSVRCVLHKTKTNQEESGPKDPRHIYANLAQPACCWVLTLGLYLSANPTLASGKLFPRRNNGAKSVWNAFNLEGVATYASSGSTGGPSIVSVCLRCGWPLGGVQDRFFRYEAAGDQYLGRVVAGLPDNPQFAELPPHFDNPNADVVKESTSLIFSPAQNDAHVASILQLCLASLVKHAEYLRSILSETHPLFSSYVFRQPDKMATLQAMLADGRTSWMRPTGIPPHVELFQQHAQTRQAFKNLPDILLGGFSAILEEKCVGRQSLARETLTVTIKSLLEEAGLWQSQPRPQEATQPLDEINNFHHWPSDRRFHRIPETFEFPQLDALGVWRLWWLGNRGAGHPPFRALQGSDFTKSNKEMFSEWSVLVRHIKAGVEGTTGNPMQYPATQAEADHLYQLGMSKVPLMEPTHLYKQRPERAVTTLRRIR